MITNRSHYRLVVPALASSRPRLSACVLVTRAALWLTLICPSVGCDTTMEADWWGDSDGAEPNEPRLPREPRPRLPEEKEWDLGETGSGSADQKGPPLPEVPFVAHSLFCGDNVRGSGEQCDSGEPNDFCTSRCRAQDTLAIAPLPEPAEPVALSTTGPPLLNGGAQLAEVGGGRVLGDGPHPIAAGDTGFAVALVDREDGARVNLATFEADGDRRDVHQLGDESSFSDVAQPVVAALPEGLFAVAWTGFDADDDELGIHLQLVHPDDGPVGEPIAANTTVVGAQQDPDIVWTGSELVVAWTDYSSLSTRPDIRYRTFDANLVPTSSEAGLGISTAVEGSVSLAPFDGSWAAAWRTSESDGQARIDVATSEGIFSLPNLTAGPMGERPALVELDSSHLLVVFTTGSDPESTGAANTGRLQYKVIDTAGPASLTPQPLLPLVPPYSTDPSLSQGEPSLTRSGDSIYLAWSSGPVVASPLEEDVWLKTLVWSSTSSALDVSRPERLLPISIPHRWGDQRAPRLAASPVFPQGTVLTAWVDYGRNLPEAAGPDVVAQLRELSEPCSEYPWQAAPPFSLGLPTTPDGTADNPYPICHVEQLEYLAQNPSHHDKHFVLMTDLDLTGFDEQLGTFTGTFDGNGHTLAYFSFVNPAANNAGFFGTLQGDGTLDGTTDGVVKNLNFLKPTISGASYTGVVVGQVVAAANIENVHVVGGSVTSSGSRFGGIAGNVLGRLADSSSSATVTGTGASSIAGGLVGEAGATAVIERCSASAGVSGASSEAGGLIGKNWGAVSRSSASGAVSAATQVGGLVGTNAGSLTDSYARGAVTAGTAGSANGSRAGALIGQTEAGSTVTRGYASGKVSAATHAGGLTGYENGASIYSASIWNNTANAALGAVGNLGTAPTGALAKTAADMKLRSTYLALSWDFLNAWAVYDGADFPEHLSRDYDFCRDVPQQNAPPFAVGLGADGTAAKPYPLCTVGQLQHFADSATGDTLRSKHFRMMGAIGVATLSGTLSTLSKAFTGNFDGNGYTLSGFARTSTDSGVGLFSSVSGTVRNLTLYGFDAQGGASTGALVGTVSSTGVIENVHLVSGTVGSALATATYIGGLVGNLSGRVSQCTASGAISSTAAGYVGGLVGQTQSGSVIEFSSSTGSVTFAGTTGRVGGLVGMVNGGTIRDSASSATVWSNTASTGGLVGRAAASGAIVRCTASGAVTSAGIYTGGLVGISTGATVEECASSGDVAGAGYTGGLVGSFSTAAGAVTASTSTSTVTSSSNYVGGLVGYSAGASITDSGSSGSVYAQQGSAGGLLGGGPSNAPLIPIVRSWSTSDVSGGSLLGGLVGIAYNLAVTESWASGTVTQSFSNALRAGGLAGYLDNSTVANSYARGNIAVAGSYGGGFIGLTVSSTVTNCYASGTVSGAGTKGGFYGDAGMTATASGSFWNTTANPGLSGAGSGPSTGLFGRTATELKQQATYTAQSWDFTTIWMIDEGQDYAELR